MKTVRSRIALLTCLLTGMIGLPLARPAASQSVSVQASVDETTVGAEEVVSFMIEVQGASFSDVVTPSAPETEGLALIQAMPGTQQNVSLINGVMQRSIAFRWSYRPLREGRAVIRPTEVEVKGRRYSTDVIELQVVPQSQRPARRNSRRTDPFSSLLSPPPSAPADDDPPAVSSNDLFIRAIPNARQVFQNEQVNITYHLFFREGMQLRQSRLADSWDAEGFWREELDVERRPIPRTVIENGLRYNTIVLKRVAVFPTRTGMLTVDPLRIEAEAFVSRGSRDPFDQFFAFRPRYEPVEVASPPVEIEVTPLPEGAPEGFTGAVGSYSIEARVDRNQVEVGEPLQIELKINGTGNIATLDPPVFEPPGIFETYEPRTDIQIDRSGDHIRGTKTLTYVLVPRSNGLFELPQVGLSYFDTGSEQYRTLRPRATSVRVTGTPIDPVAATSASAGLPVDDIAGLINEAASWERSQPTLLHRHPWVYLLLAMPIVVIGGVMAYQRHTSRLAADVRYARSRRAHPVARKHLKKAERLLAEIAPRAFYEEVERAVRSYIGNRMNIPETGLTYQQLDAHLAAAGVPGQVRADCLALLEECDRVRYAPILPDKTEMTTACERASSFIVEMDQALKPRGASV